MEKLTIAILHALVHVCVCVYVCRLVLLRMTAFLKEPWLQRHCQILWKQHVLAKEHMQKQLNWLSWHTWFQTYMVEPYIFNSDMQLTTNQTSPHVAMWELESTDDLHDAKTYHHDSSTSHHISLRNINAILASLSFCLFPNFVWAPLKDV